MDPERFKNSPAGGLAKGNLGGRDYWAFVPNPLPPRLEPDIELMNALSDADRAVGELSGLGRTMANPHLFVHPFIRREAVLSSRIEGTRTGIVGLYAYEAGQPPLPGLGTPGLETDAQEVLNYVRALEYGLERVTTLPVSLRLVRELHSILMKGVRGETASPGEFRRVQNWIGAPGSDVTHASFVPPPPREMSAAMEALEQYLHAEADYPPLVRLALTHYQFECIHPFADGNGRIGRLLISLLLSCWNLISQPLLYVSAYFEQNRAQYYDLLHAVSERGAWRDWVAFFLRGVAEQSRDANARAKRLQDLQIEYRQRLQKEGATGKILMAADLLFETPVVSVPGVQQALGVTHRTASLIVEKLTREAILSPVGDRLRNRQFVASEVLSIVSGDGEI